MTGTRQSWSRVKLLVPVFVAAAALLLAAFAPTAGPPPKAPTWRTDLAAATREAKAAGKDVLVEFTAVDAATGEARLDRVVYNDPRFLRAAAERFIPVRLTVRTGDPDRPVDVGVVALAERLAVARVPSLVLIDGSNRPYAAVESETESIEAQLASLQNTAAERAKRDEAFARAAQSAGPERAARLNDALQHVGRFALAGYESEVGEIITLDPDDALGLKKQYAGPLSEKRIDRAIQQQVYPLVDRADFAGAIAAIEQIVTAENPSVAQRQTLVAFKGQLLYSMGKKDEARWLLDQAIAMAPDDPAARRIAAAKQQMEE